MNSKTTLLLAALLAGLVLGYIGLRRQIPPASSALTLPTTPTETSVTRDLLSEPLGNVVKIVAKRGDDEWVFEKKTASEGGAAAWHMTRPMEAKVLSHEVDRIAREAGKIQYEISYKPGDGAMTAQDAGLNPPATTITLTDDAGKFAAIEIGKPVSENETYVRKAGDETIVVAKANLRKLLKAKPLEYRDLQLWNFLPEHAAHVEICETQPHGSFDCQSFAREEGRWMLERPLSARATNKVDEMLKAVPRLRVTQWLDDDGTKLKMYGLDPGALQINVTVEETVPVAKEDADESKSEDAPAEVAPPATEKRTRIYKLQVADRGPIGEDTKVFVRSSDENAVATIFKSAADKFKPVMSEWREMQIVSADPTRASRIELDSGGQKTVLAQKEGQWFFDGDGAVAEQHAVTELLAGIKGLKAVSFVEGPDAGPPPNFDSPQTDIRLTIPGVEGVERVTVGGYTDPAKKLLVYVRHGDSGSVAKVKATDVTALLRPPAALRDRTVFHIAPDDVTRIALSRPNEYSEGDQQEFTLEKKDGIWSMTSPASAPVRTDEVTKLAATLASLKAESIAAEATEATAFGLHDPAIKVTFSVVESADEPNEGGTIGALNSHQLLLTEHDGKNYAKRDDGGPIYELNRAVLDQLRAEFRTGDVLEFEPKDVQHMTIRNGNESHAFARKHGKWVYEAEPDLPIDSAKVEKILSDAKSLKTERYAACESANTGEYALDKPHFELQLTMPGQTQPDDKTYTLRVSEKTVNHQSTAPAVVEGKPATPPSTTAHFASSSDRDGVFLLSADAVKKVFVPLSEIEKK